MSAISENIQSVSSISDIQNMSEELQKNPDRLKEFLNSIPNIALGLLGKIIIIAIVFFIGSRLIRFVRKLLRKALERAGTSRNAINFVDTCLKYVLYILLVLGILTNFGLEATSIVAFIGSLGVTIGLALQGSLSNLAGGVLLLIMKPFKEGDYIKEYSKNIEGTVTEVQIFYTKIHTTENFTVMIPNGTLANNAIINYSRAKSKKLDLVYSISYNSDIKLAKKIITDILMNDPMYNKEQKADPEIFVKELADSSVIIGARAWVNSDTYGDYCSCRNRVNENVKMRFDEAGIEIPFPQLEIHKK